MEDFLDDIGDKIRSGCATTLLLKPKCFDIDRMFADELLVRASEVLALAGVAAHSVVRPAAPLTTFIAGFAAGLASGSGQATDSVSMESAMAVARRLAKDYAAAETSGA